MFCLLCPGTKWISFINRSFLDVYGVKLAALSRSHSDRDEFRLQTTVVTPFHLNKEVQAKYGIERDVALMTSDGDFFWFWLSFYHSDAHGCQD